MLCFLIESYRPTNNDGLRLWCLLALKEVKVNMDCGKHHPWILKLEFGSFLLSYSQKFFFLLFCSFAFHHVVLLNTPDPKQNFWVKWGKT